MDDSQGYYEGHANKRHKYGTLRISLLLNSIKGPEGGEMFGRKRHREKARDSYIGSVLVTMTQAAIAVSEETDKQVDTKNTLLDLVMGTVTRAESELSDPETLTYLLDLVNYMGQTDENRQAWRMFAELDVDEELAVHLADTFDRLASSRREDAYAAYLEEVAPSFGFDTEEDVPFVFQILAMHASVTMVTVFQDTLTSTKVEQAERRFWAAFYEGLMIATWMSWERLAIKHGKPLGYEPRL